MKREVVKSVVSALIVTVLLGVAIVVGSRNLSRFDSALVAYTFASLFAAFGLTYRYAMWLQRPPTALYWRRGWEAFFKRPYRKQNAINWFKEIDDRQTAFAQLPKPQRDSSERAHKRRVHGRTFV